MVKLEKLNDEQKDIYLTGFKFGYSIGRMQGYDDLQKLLQKQNINEYLVNGDKSIDEIINEIFVEK